MQEGLAKAHFSAVRRFLELPSTRRGERIEDEWQAVA